MLSAERTTPSPSFFTNTQPNHHNAPDILRSCIRHGDTYKAYNRTYQTLPPLFHASIGLQDTVFTCSRTSIRTFTKQSTTGLQNASRRAPGAAAAGPHRRRYSQGQRSLPASTQATLPLVNTIRNMNCVNDSSKRKSIHNGTKIFLRSKSSSSSFSPSSSSSSPKTSNRPLKQRNPLEPLPDKYKPAARRVTALIVAIPFFIVTSWILYKRLALGTPQRKVPPQRPLEVTSYDDI